MPLKQISSLELKPMIKNSSDSLDSILSIYFKLNQYKGPLSVVNMTWQKSPFLSKDPILLTIIDITSKSF